MRQKSAKILGGLVHSGFITGEAVDQLLANLRKRIRPRMARFENAFLLLTKVEQVSKYRLQDWSKVPERECYGSKIADNKDNRDINHCRQPRSPQVFFSILYNLKHVKDSFAVGFSILFNLEHVDDFYLQWDPRTLCLRGSIPL